MFRSTYDFLQAEARGKLIRKGVAAKATQRQAMAGMQGAGNSLCFDKTAEGAERLSAEPERLLQIAS